MAQAAFPILQKMVTDQLIPAIQKAIQGEFAKAQQGQKPQQPAQAKPAAQAPAAAPAQTPTQPPVKK
jgi:hypothetical protein